MCVRFVNFKLQSSVLLRLQDTLIVWAEADNYDLALSFQEKIGCDEIWEKICHVREIVYVLRCALRYGVTLHIRKQTTMYIEIRSSVICKEF